MWQKNKSSTINFTSLIIIFFILIVFGLIMIASVTSIIGYTSFQDNYYYLKHQLLFGLLPGLALFFICAKINYKFWQKNALLIFIASLVFLLLVFIPGLGVEYNNAKSWLIISGASIQPAEIAKLALIIYLATWFAKSKEHLKSFSRGLLPFLVFLGLIAVLIALQPDIGTLLVVVAIAATMYYVAGADFKHLLSFFIACGGVLVALIIAAPYRFNRILAFLNPEIGGQTISYHINQALLAIGSGGLLGLGFGKSRQKFAYLPEISGDSIFAIIAEELGFIICTIFIFLLIYFITQIIKNSLEHKDDFTKLFSIGLAAWIGWQSFFNIGAMLGILPLTGVPLPFISYGGTSLMILMASFGILVNINKK
ncbi:MAG TPA: putative peptidoglycan glycosyltransferase FtsW [bacterium]|nr:putative peptidoglycan glycosyltransferase FtsW [bacterium]